MGGGGRRFVEGLYQALFSFHLAPRNLIDKAKRKYSLISGYHRSACMILNVFDQRFLARDAYNRTIGREVINGRSKFTSQRQFASVRERARVTEWEGPWVRLTVKKRAKTSRERTTERPSSLLRLLLGLTWLLFNNS